MLTFVNLLHFPLTAAAAVNSALVVPKIKQNVITVRLLR